MPPLATIANNPSVVAAQNNLHRGENDFAAIRQRYKEKHPKFLQMVSQMQELQGNLNDEVMKVAQTLKAAVASARTASSVMPTSCALRCFSVNSPSAIGSDRRILMFTS